MTYTLVRHPNPYLKQYRSPRRMPLSGLIVVHSAENVPDLHPPDTGAENVAAYISRRSTPGSYHTVVDSDSIVGVMPWEWEAWHDGTGTNPHSIGISGAFRAHQFDTLPEWWRTATVTNMALSAAAAAQWLQTTHGIVVPPRRISAAQARTGRQPGFVSHGELDPARRSDPGPHFPWVQFLAAFAYFMGLSGSVPPPQPKPPPNPELQPVTFTAQSVILRPSYRGGQVAQLQKILRDWCDQPLHVDGVFGPGTERAVRNVQGFFGLTTDGIVGPQTWAAISLCVFPR
jgi:hypothetical protein